MMYFRQLLFKMRRCTWGF